MNDCCLFLFYVHNKFIAVLKASALLTKGKNNSNDCFVTIVLGKVKYHTSIKQKAAPSVEWYEECELYVLLMHHT